MYFSWSLFHSCLSFKLGPWTTDTYDWDSSNQQTGSFSFEFERIFLLCQAPLSQRYEIWLRFKLEVVELKIDFSNSVTKAVDQRLSPSPPCGARANPRFTDQSSFRSRCCSSWWLEPGIPGELGGDAGLVGEVMELWRDQRSRIEDGVITFCK